MALFSRLSIPGVSSALVWQTLPIKTMACMSYQWHVHPQCNGVLLYIINMEHALSTFPYLRNVLFSHIYHMCLYGMKTYGSMFCVSCNVTWDWPPPMREDVINVVSSHIGSDCSHVIWGMVDHSCSHGPHDDVTKCKHFPRYWPFVWGIHRSQVNSPHKGQWRGALMFPLICAWTNTWETMDTPVIWDAIALIMTSLKTEDDTKQDNAYF